MKQSVSGDVSQDAVVVVPGVMGSGLVDAESGDVLWGLHRLGWYRKAWTTGSSLRRLRNLEPGRVRADGLLRFPAWAPLGMIEPYTNLVRGIRQVVAHEDAVLEFAYDWRLPVEHNAGLLAARARAHLDRWRRHPAHQQARRSQPDEREARLVIVAHSMGGLVARALGLVEGLGDVPMITEDVRATVTLGTPFEGAAKAAVILSTGRDAPLPLPRKRLRRLAVGLPGLHDLLPIYRCVDTGTDVRRLAVSDVVGLGGSAELATCSFDFHRRLAATPLVGHRPLVGVEQPTVQTLRLANGVATGSLDTFRVHANGELVRDRRDHLPVRFPGFGDGTVPRNSATLTGTDPQFEAQQHGSLGHVDEAVTFVRSIITGQELGGRLGAGDVGIDVPDVVAPGVELPISVSGVDGPDEVGWEVVDAETGVPVDTSGLRRRDSVWQFTVTLPEERLYRVAVHGGGSPVTQLVLATDVTAHGDDDDDD